MTSDMLTDNRDEALATIRPNSQPHGDDNELGDIGDESSALCAPLKSRSYEEAAVVPKNQNGVDNDRTFHGQLMTEVGNRKRKGINPMWRNQNLGDTRLNMPPNVMGQYPDGSIKWDFGEDEADGLEKSGDGPENPIQSSSENSTSRSGGGSDETDDAELQMNSKYAVDQELDKGNAAPESSRPVVNHMVQSLDPTTGDRLAHSDTRFCDGDGNYSRPPLPAKASQNYASTERGRKNGTNYELITDRPDSRNQPIHRSPFPTRDAFEDRHFHHVRPQMGFRDQEYVTSKYPFDPLNESHNRPSPFLLNHLQSPDPYYYDDFEASRHFYGPFPSDGPYGEPSRTATTPGYGRARGTRPWAGEDIYHGGEQHPGITPPRYYHTLVTPRTPANDKYYNHGPPLQHYAVEDEYGRDDFNRYGSLRPGVHQRPFCYNMPPIGPYTDDGQYRTDRWFRTYGPQRLLHRHSDVLANGRMTRHSPIIPLDDRIKRYTEHIYNEGDEGVRIRTDVCTSQMPLPKPKKGMVPETNEAFYNQPEDHEYWPTVTDGNAKGAGIKSMNKIIKARDKEPLPSYNSIKHANNGPGGPNDKEHLNYQLETDEDFCKMEEKYSDCHHDAFGGAPKKGDLGKEVDQQSFRKPLVDGSRGFTNGYKDRQQLLTTSDSPGQAGDRQNLREHRHVADKYEGRQPEGVYERREVVYGHRVCNNTTGEWAVVPYVGDERLISHIGPNHLASELNRSMMSRWSTYEPADAMYPQQQRTALMTIPVFSEDCDCSSRMLSNVGRGEAGNRRRHTLACSHLTGHVKIQARAIIPPLGNGIRPEDEYYYTAPDDPNSLVKVPDKFLVGAMKDLCRGHGNKKAKASKESCKVIKSKGNLPPQSDQVFALSEPLVDYPCPQGMSQFLSGPSVILKDQRVAIYEPSRGAGHFATLEHPFINGRLSHEGPFQGHVTESDIPLYSDFYGGFDHSNAIRFNQGANDQQNITLRSNGVVDGPIKDHYTLPQIYANRATAKDNNNNINNNLLMANPGGGQSPKNMSTTIVDIDGTSSNGTSWTKKPLCHSWCSGLFITVWIVISIMAIGAILAGLLVALY